MADSLLDKPVIHMPHLGKGEWLNTPHPLSREQLRGQVALVDFWDFTCVNCLRTLPYLKAWHERYADKGLTIIGVHTPEFKIGQPGRFVRAAIEQFNIPYPVLLDNHYATWDQFANRAWPSKYLVDADGYIRFHRQGEGYYRETEQAIQSLLHRLNPAVSFPDLLPSLRPEDIPGAVCYRTTPECHAGYQGGLFGGALGNPEGYITGSPMAYVLPGPFDLQEGRFYLAGFWRATAEAMVFAGQEGGRVVLPYSAAGVNAVLSPSHDPVELMLDIRPGQEIPLIEIRQDDAPLDPAVAGRDVFFDGQRALVQVDRPRMYELVKLPDYGSHELDLIVHVHGLALYAFTFNSCIAPAGGADAKVFTQR
jgi:thiol-disulfide isomerase/thioredoxin